MANSLLRQYFPMIRTREEVLSEIRKKDSLWEEFHRWTDDQQEEFLNFCTGVKGVKLLYDSFFKEIMNPDAKPERLEELLSLLLRQEIKIRGALPTDNSRLADESSLLIMDILIELADGSLANLEVQRAGYMFPGQRCACYSADLLLRQYKRVRGKKGKRFSYRDIKSVYTIVLMERSTEEFHKFPGDYIHHSRQQTDTGLKIDLLQEYILIPLDIFRENLYNKRRNNDVIDELDAWLAFLSMDDPEWIVWLMERKPKFQSMYREAYEMCRNVEDIMGYFSEELRILDRNTVQLMIDEMQDRIDRQSEQLGEKDKQLDEQKVLFEKQLDEQTKQLGEQTKQLDEQTKQLGEQTKQLDEQKRQLGEQSKQLDEQKAEIERLKKLLASNHPAE